MTSRHVGPAAALILCGVLWSTGGLLIKLSSWPPLAIWCARSAIAAAFLWMVARPRWHDVGRADIGAAVTYALTTALFIAANKNTTAANAILIQYAAPVWVALASYRLLGEVTTQRDWWFLGGTLVGVGLFFAGDLGAGHLLGNVFALTASVTFAAHVMFMRRANDPLRAFIIGGGMAALLGVPFLLAAPAPSGGDLIAIGLLGLVQQGATALLFAWAIRRVSALEGLLLPMLEPVLSPLWVALVVGEVPGPIALVGGAIVIGLTILRATHSRVAAGHPIAD